MDKLSPEDRSVNYIKHLLPFDRKRLLINHINTFKASIIRSTNSVIQKKQQKKIDTLLSVATEAVISRAAPVKKHEVLDCIQHTTYLLDKNLPLRASDALNQLQHVFFERFSFTLAIQLRQEIEQIVRNASMSIDLAGQMELNNFLDSLLFESVQLLSSTFDASDSDIRRKKAYSG